MVSHLGHQVMKRSPVPYNLRKRQSPTVGDCTTQSLYKSPVEDQIVDSAQKLAVDWDTSCFTTDTVDIKLYLATSTNATERRIRFYKGVPNNGGIQLPIYPRWWHNAPTVDLYLMIQEGGAPFPGMYGPGPTFTATYDGSANSGSDMSIVDEGYTYFKELIQGLSGGQIAGAVIGCILFVGLLIGSIFFVRRARAKRAAQSKRFSQMVDKRMSTISQNWSSISPSAAQAAIRNSMAVYGRPSGDASMQSSLSLNAATGHGAHPGNTVGTGLRPQRERTTSRATRVSFAPESMYGTTGRPSSSIRNSTASGLGRGNYFNDTDAPPMPRKSTLGTEITLSPTQAAGALALSPSDVEHRASQYNDHGDVGPALSMMRESDGSDHPMYYAARVETPLPPVPAATSSAKSPVGMMPMLDSSLSPDALMRGYASKNRDGLRLNTQSIATSGSDSPVSSGPAYPTPAATRTVYTPQSAAGSNPFRKSVAASVASGFLPYDGMEDDEPAVPQQRSHRF